MEPVVEVSGLCKAYEGRVVVDDVDLDVYEGEVVGLLGTNGAGKTTTVECIQGLRRPDAGHIRVLGLDPSRQPEAVRAVIGSQLQHSALPDRMKVDEAVGLFCRGPVADVVVRDTTVELVGDRTMIAWVGAWLAAEGPIPDDLWVRVPDLEDAVVHLLQDPVPTVEPVMEVAS